MGFLYAVYLSLFTILIECFFATLYFFLYVCAYFLVPILYTVQPVLISTLMFIFYSIIAIIIFFFKILVYIVAIFVCLIVVFLWFVFYIIKTFIYVVFGFLWLVYFLIQPFLSIFLYIFKSIGAFFFPETWYVLGYILDTPLETVKIESVRILTQLEGIVFDKKTMHQIVEFIIYKKMQPIFIKIFGPFLSKIISFVLFHLLNMFFPGFWFVFWGYVFFFFTYYYFLYFVSFILFKLTMDFGNWLLWFGEIIIISPLSPSAILTNLWFYFIKPIANFVFFYLGFFIKPVFDFLLWPVIDEIFYQIYDYFSGTEMITPRFKVSENFPQNFFEFIDPLTKFLTNISYEFSTSPIANVLFFYTIFICIKYRKKD